MDGLWLDYADKHALLEERVSTLPIETRWSRKGISFLPLELERSGVPADSLDSLGRKALRTGVRVDLADGLVVRQSTGGVVSFHERNGQLGKEISYANRNGKWVLSTIKILAFSDDGIPSWGRAMSRPREVTTSYVEESYVFDHGRISGIHRELTQIDRGRELRSSIDFDVLYGVDGTLAEIHGTSRRTPPAKDVTERVYPRSK